MRWPTLRLRANYLYDMGGEIMAEEDKSKQVSKPSVVKDSDEAKVVEVGATQVEVKKPNETEVKKPDEAEPVVSEKAIAEQEVKQAFLKRFRRKKEIKSSKEAKKTTEVVNTDDLAEKLYRDIAKTQRKEFVVLRVRKRTLLFAGGVLLVLMWLLPLIRWFVSAGFSKPVIQKVVEEVKTEVSPTSVPVEAVDNRINDTGIMIRIRDNGGEGMAQSLQTHLLSKGYLNVELIDDHGSQYTGLGVVVKPNAIDLREEVESIIGDKYDIASPSAELTEDSEVDALVLFGLQVED